LDGRLKVGLRPPFSLCSPMALMGFSLCTIEQSQDFRGDIILSLFSYRENLR
jgi:hypothetical protein